MVQITDIVYEMNLTGFSGDLDDIADGTTYGKVLQTALDSGQIDLGGAGITGNLPATALVEGCQSFVSNLAFVPKVGDTHDSISWGAGTITFSDGSSLAIDAGSFDNQTEATHWIYFTIGSSSLSTTTTYSNCVGDNKGPLCLYGVSSDATQQVLIRAFFSKGLNIQADVIAALAIQTLHLAAEAVTADKIEAGTITTNELNFTPLFSSGGTGQIIATINASAEGIDIAADNIAISGSTTFSAGYDPTDKVDELGGSYASDGSNPRIRIFPDANTGIIATDGGGNTVFEILVGGTDVGDVTIGDPASSRYLRWDESAGALVLSADAGNVVIDESGITVTGGAFVLKSAVSPNPRVEILNTGIIGYSDATTVEFELDAADGKAKAGGGKVILDEDGVHIIGDTGAMLTIHKTGLGDPRGILWNGTINGIENIILSDGALGYGAVLQAGSSYFQVKPGGSFYFFGTSLLPVGGPPDIGTIGNKFGNIFGASKYTDLHLLDTHCPKCGELFEMDDSINFTVIAVESLEDSQGTPYDQIRCIPIHVKCPLWSRIKRWLRDPLGRKVIV